MDHVLQSNDQGPPGSSVSGKSSTYAVIWRLHFYAGLFCVPFILWLAITGSIYLFKPQIDALIDRPFDELESHGPVKPPSARVASALTAVDGSVLNAYELPQSPRSASRVLVGRGAELYRVYVHPQTLAILKVIRDDQRFTRLLFYLHGELLLGRPGSMVVELAASWTIVMLLTGWYLWWPRDGRWVAGVLLPRLATRGRIMWRDLHAVTGFWVSVFVLFLLVSGLPWAASWGQLLKTAREIAAQSTVQQPWSTSSDEEAGERLKANRQARPVHHHGGGGGVAMSEETGAELDRLVSVVVPLEMAYPVLLAPPAAGSSQWTARSEAESRPLRESLVWDSSRGTIVNRTKFAQWPLIDRLVGYGVTIHIGQMFGWLNQALGVFTAAGLVTAVVSGMVMWWRRRPSGRLGAPPRREGLSVAPVLCVVLALLAVVLPLLGLTLLAVLALDRWLLPKIPGVAHYLGAARAA